MAAMQSVDLTGSKVGGVIMSLGTMFDPSIVEPGVAVPGVPSTEAMSF